MTIPFIFSLYTFKKSYFLLKYDICENTNNISYFKEELIMFNVEGLGYFGSKKPAHLLGIYIYKDVYANGVDVKITKAVNSIPSATCEFNIKHLGDVKVLEGHPEPILADEELVKFLDNIRSFILNIISDDINEMLQNYLYNTLPSIAEAFEIRVEK